MSSEPSFFKYADDNQIFFSDCDLVVVKSAINGDLAVDDNKLRCSIPRNVNVLLFQNTILVIFP